MELVCDYLLSQKVAVKGYVKQGGTVTEKTEEQAEEHYTEEEKRYARTLYGRNQNNKGRGSRRATKVICSLDRRRCTCKGED